MDWEEAQEYIRRINKNSSPETIRKNVKKISKILQSGVRRDIKNLRKEITRVQIRGLQKHFNIVEYKTIGTILFIKTLLVIFFIVLGAISVSHLFKKTNDKIRSALISYALFYTLQSIANLAFVVICFVDALLRKRTTQIIPTITIFIAFTLEIPMLASQAYVMTNVENLVWGILHWDVALQFLFIFKLWLFLAIDILYIGCRVKKMMFLTAVLVFVLPPVICGFVFAPVHLVQLGWIWRPTITDFGGKLDDSETSNLLTLSMFIGALGLWVWPFFFIIVCLVAAWKFGVSWDEMLNKYCLTIFKLSMVFFNILNGVWSLQQMYALHKNTRNTIALNSFATFFGLQVVANLVYILFSPMKSSNVIKFGIAFFLEMPMLTSQVYAIRNVEELVWSKFNWHLAMQVEFMINLSTFFYFDTVLKRYGAKLMQVVIRSPIILLLLWFLPATIFTPIYLVEIGFDYTPNLNSFGGEIGNESNGIVGLLYLTMCIGATSFYIWTALVIVFVIAVVGLSLIHI